MGGNGRVGVMVSGDSGGEGRDGGSDGGRLVAWLAGRGWGWGGMVGGGGWVVPMLEEVLHLQTSQKLRIFNSAQPPPSDAVFFQQYCEWRLVVAGRWVGG